MPLFIGNSEVEKVFIGETEVQTVRTEGDLRFNAFTNTPPQVSLSANAASYLENVSATFTATVIDPDVPSLQTLTYVWTDNGTVVRTTTGTSSLTDAYTVSYSSGTRTIGVTVTDSGSGVSNNVTIARSWLITRNCSVNAAGFLNDLSSNGGYYSQLNSFSGGGTASMYNGGTTDGACGITKFFSSSTEGFISPDHGSCSLSSAYTGFSVPASATHASCSTSVSRTF